MSIACHPSENVTTRDLCCPREKTKAAFQTFVHSFVRSFIHLFVCSFIHAGHPLLATGRFSGKQDSQGPVLTEIMFKSRDR